MKDDNLDSFREYLRAKNFDRMDNDTYRNKDIIFNFKQSYMHVITETFNLILFYKDTQVLYKDRAITLYMKKNNMIEIYLR